MPGRLYFKTGLILIRTVFQYVIPSSLHIHLEFERSSPLTPQFSLLVEFVTVPAITLKFVANFYEGSGHESCPYLLHGTQQCIVKS